MANCVQVWRRHLSRGVSEGAQLIRNEAIRNVTGRVLNRQTGHGARSIRARSGLQSRGAFIRVFNPVFYMAAWERGFHRPAYTVVPTRAKALKIPIRGIGGGFIFRKSARIPAKTFAARPWLSKAADDMLPKVRAVIADEMVKAYLECLPGRLPRQ